MSGSAHGDSGLARRRVLPCLSLNLNLYRNRHERPPLLFFSIAVLSRS